MEFYAKFTRMCQERGEFPSQVAKAIGLDASSAAYWKRGSVPKPKTLEKLAAHFGVSVEDLLSDVNDGSEKESGTSWAVSDDFRLRNIEITDDGKINCSFELDDAGLTAEELRALIAFYQNLSKKYEVSIKEITENAIVEFTEDASQADLNRHRRLRVTQTYNMDDESRVKRDSHKGRGKK